MSEMEPSRSTRDMLAHHPAEGTPSPPVHTLALQLVQRLCRRLHAENVDYCHWKSNFALDRSATGDNDLDLLISRASMCRFTQILCLLGFKEARGTIERQLPGVLDYYGYDSKTGKLVHVHAHYQLVLGHDKTKNYRLLIEEAFLASARQEGLFRVPAPELEFIAFVLRMNLKYSIWDDAFRNKRLVLPNNVSEELEYLQARIRGGRVRQLLQQHLPDIDGEFFDACVETLRIGCAVTRRVRVGAGLRRRLSAYARRPQAVDIYLKLWRRAAGAGARRLGMRPRRRRLTGGGTMIALVGGDGAGKSTTAAALTDWLSKDLDVRIVHMGRPPRSVITHLIRGTLRIARLMGKNPVRRFHPWRASTTLETMPDYSQALRDVCLARDRYIAYLEGRRLASNGGIVICDRFPLPQIGQMDGPRIERSVRQSERTRLRSLLASLENAWYSSIGSPDVLIVLMVDPETAVARKPDEEASSVRRRAAEIWDLDWKSIKAHVVDANRPHPEVLAELKSIVWSLI